MPNEIQMKQFSFVDLDPLESIYLVRIIKESRQLDVAEMALNEFQKLLRSVRILPAHSLLYQNTSKFDRHLGSVLVHSGIGSGYYVERIGSLGQNNRYTKIVPFEPIPYNYSDYLDEPHRDIIMAGEEIITETRKLQRLDGAKMTSIRRTRKQTAKLRAEWAPLIRS